MSTKGKKIGLKEVDKADKVKKESPKVLKPLVLPRMTADELREAVNALCDNRIFTSSHLGEHDVNLLPSLFMPIVFGALSEYTEESLKQIGVIYEYYDKAGPRSLNGFPMFFSMRMMHVDDWKIVHASATKETERRKGIDLISPEEKAADVGKDLQDMVGDVPTTLKVATAAEPEKK